MDGKYLLLPWDNEASLGRLPDGSFITTYQFPITGENLLLNRLLKNGSPVRSRYNELVNEFYISESETIEGEVAATRWLNRYLDFKSEIDRAVSLDHMRSGNYEDFLDEESYITDFFTRRASEL